MQIELRYLSEKDKKEICGWKYDGKYAMYNLSDHEQMRTVWIFQSREGRGILRDMGRWRIGRICPCMSRDSEDYDRTWCAPGALRKALWDNYIKVGLRRG